MEIIDITPTINSRMAVFPGDTPFSEEFLMSTDKGQHLTLSKITTTVHLGAHTDAPNHYAPRSESIETRSLDFYLGHAQVIEVSLPRGARIQVADLKGKNIQAPRVLFKTKSFPNPYQWNDDFNALSAELVNYLHEKKVILVGIDTPSVDPATDKVLESHLAIHKHDMAILEGIVLDHVQEGTYELIALPLKIEGADATPVRAILRKYAETR
ncbi:cyclase family protein [Bdellovibrio sp. HCB337]|uniref:cyclase family protein n=1 Tax=Bdellovibrio sp. HCB337 TaxID=3394358 RepID=UPI0039A555BC